MRPKREDAPYFLHMREAEKDYRAREKEILLMALKESGGKIAPAARLIGITNGYFRRRAEALGLIVRGLRPNTVGNLTLSPEVPVPVIPPLEPVPVPVTGSNPIPTSEPPLSKDESHV
jgi:hypothetical protein